jgi:hypothetical protein
VIDCKDLAFSREEPECGLMPGVIMKNEVNQKFSGEIQSSPSVLAVFSDVAAVLLTSD